MEGRDGSRLAYARPQAAGPGQGVEEIAEAAGREIRYVPVTLEEYAAVAAEQGEPDEFIELLTYLFSEVLDGRNAQVADGIQRALDREPRDFREYARNAAATGVWNGPAVPVTPGR